MKKDIHVNVTGGCLCGQVRFAIHGPMRDIINCHCQNCRRCHGHIAAYTSVQKKQIQFLQKQGLVWYHDQSPDTFRGFCRSCGASLFWDANNGKRRLSVSAGSLDASAGLKISGHIYVAEAGDYYAITDDLPQYRYSSDGALESS